MERGTADDLQAVREALNALEEERRARSALAPIADVTEARASLDRVAARLNEQTARAEKAEWALNKDSQYFELLCKREALAQAESRVAMLERERDEQAARAEAGCAFGCGPMDTGVYVGPGIVPACPVHGWVCALLDARDELAAGLERQLSTTGAEAASPVVGTEIELQAENERLREALQEYASHQSWRCEYRSRYKACWCGLDGVMRSFGLDPVAPLDPGEE